MHAYIDGTIIEFAESLTRELYVIGKEEELTLHGNPTPMSFVHLSGNKRLMVHDAVGPYESDDENSAYTDESSSSNRRVVHCLENVD